MDSTDPYGDAWCGPDLTVEEIAWLRALAAGTRVVDLARDSGYSERAMYRELRKLWDRLGARGRAEGLGRAADLGLLVDEAADSRPSRGATPP